MTEQDTPNEVETPAPPDDPSDGVIEGADTDGYVNDETDPEAEPESGVPA